MFPQGNFDAQSIMDACGVDKQNADLTLLLYFELVWVDVIAFPDNPLPIWIEEKKLKRNKKHIASHAWKDGVSCHYVIYPHNLEKNLTERLAWRKDFTERNSLGTRSIHDTLFAVVCHEVRHRIQRTRLADWKDGEKREEDAHICELDAYLLGRTPSTEDIRHILSISETKTPSTL